MKQKKRLLLGVLLVLVMGLFAGGVQGQTTGTLTDARDSQTYTIVTIGTQTWMAENLNYYTANYSKYWNNDSIEYADDYGLLYEQSVADTVCPTGYSLPSDSDWQILESFLGMSNADTASSGYRTSGNVGNDLKAGYNEKDRYGNVYWGTGFGNDNYNFSALPAGYFGSSFYSLGLNAYYWTSTQFNSNLYYSRVLYRGLDGIDRLYMSSADYMSVRCIKD